MPKHNLTTRPAIAKIKHATGTTMYSDPSVKPDPDARGIRLAVGATTKTWVLSKRIDGNAQKFDAMVEASRHMQEVRAMREALEYEPWLDDEGAVLSGEVTTAEGWQFDVGAMAADAQPAAWPWRNAQYGKD